ncbi:MULTISPECIES: HupE/UreJ family protein [Rhodomicrobium]|uniref:HupE/UreJ family protein n=1 Tax=Rhodomicrobium TaxID=1068 RepID=UPI000B4ADAEA|nr:MULTISPECIES: HupE/UreJ family protein [Rhodomicrobium]
MRRGAALLALLWMALLAIAGAAYAHETPIAVLRIKQETAGRYYAQWIFQSDKGLPAPTAVFPPHCTYEAPLLDCGSRGLVGMLSVEQLDQRYSGVVIQFTRAGEKTQAYTLTPGSPSVAFGPGGGSSLAALADLMRAYILIGFEHILLGVDHLLFVLGLIWLVRSRWMLLKTITAFTIAHSFTLAAATLGWVGVPERAVNAAIALSIVFVGAEIIKLQRGQIGLTVRHPWVVAFAFGLLHGFGFSNALTKLGLPQDSIVLALLSFNIGVEIGQIAFVAVVLAVQWGHRTMMVHFDRRLDPVPAYAIGGIAMFWFLGRMSMMFTS